MSNLHFTPRHGCELRHATPINLEALAIATIMEYNGDAPDVINAQNINNLAHVLNNAQLDIGYAALLDPHITPAIVQEEFMQLYLTSPQTGFSAERIAIPTLAQDAVAAELIGSYCFHFHF